MQRRGGRVASASRFLLDYDNATPVRATEAAFVDTRTDAFQKTTEAANWKGNNVARIFSDGGLLVEGARTNEMPESWFDTWALVGSATLTTDDATAPDFDSSGEGAATVTFTASATDGVSHATAIAADASTDNDTAIVSCWLRCTSGTEEARIGLLDKDTSTLLLSSDLTITTTWTHFTFEVADIGAGVVTPAGLLYNSTDAAARSVEAWGFQVEHNDPFASTSIRTTGAAATRNKDNTVYNPGDWPTIMATGKWSICWVPNFNSADDPTAGRVYAMCFAAAGHYVRFRFSGAAWVVWFANTSGNTQLTLNGGSSAWSRNDEIVTTVDHITGDVTCFKNGSDAESSISALGAAAGSWSIGNALRVGEDFSGNNQCHGILLRPVSA